MPRSHSFNRQWRAILAAIAIVLLVCTGFEASAQQKKRRGKPARTPTTQQTDSNSNVATTAATTTPPKPQKKNLAPLRGSDSPAGGRATITSDAPLNDYEAYRSGNRYYVVIPQANAPNAPGGLRGRGYDDVQVHKRGNDTVLSFRLKPGTTAHVNQKFNRLEVVFNSPGDTASTTGTTTAANTNTQSGTTGTATATGNANSSRQPTSSGATGTQGTSSSSTATTTGSTGGNVPAPGTTISSSTSSSPAPASGTSPIGAVPPGTTATLPSVTPAIGPTVDGSPVAPSPTPPADQIAQTQPAPSIPTAVTTTPATTGTSLGAVLKSNWLIVLIAALLLITIGLVAMTRSRSRRSAPAAAIDERETPAIEEGALESVEAAPVREAPVVESVAAAEAVDAAVALESPVTMDETLEAEPVEALNVEQVRLEIKHVLTGQEYDESIINTPIKESRQLIESELLFALSKRNTERRDRALKAFTEHGYFDDATRDLRTAEVPAERAAAARKLGLTRDAAATPHLSAALEDTAPEVRRAAVEALAESRDPEAIGALESLLAREEDRKVPHALIQRAIRASAAAAAAGGTAAVVQEEPPATIDVKTEASEEAVTVEAAPVTAEEVATPAAEAAPLEVADETPGVVEESLAGVPETPASPEPEASSAEAEPATAADADGPHVVEAGADSAPSVLPLAAALVAGLATAEAGAAERQRAEADAARIHAEQERQRAEEEARRREEEQRRQEQERLQAEEERRRTEEEARRKEEEQQRLEQKRAEEERQRVEAEAQRQREAAEAERIRAEEERVRAEEERVRAEAESRRQAEEERKRVEKEARLKAFEEERQRAEEARRLRAEERERRRAEEERARLEVQERERSEADAARRRAEEAALRLADMRRRAEEEARQREEAEAARLLKEEEARQRAEEEAALKLAEKEEAEARQREELELERQRAAEARRLEEEERHRRLEQERLRAEEERRRTEEEARRKAEEQQRLEQERVEAERVRVEAEARRHAEEERRRIEEEERQRAEAEAARIQFEQEAAERRRREEEAIAAEAATHIEVEEVDPVDAQIATPVVQSELFESTVADQASFMPPLETSREIVERSPSDWIDVDYNEPEVVNAEHSAGAAPVIVDEAAIVEHTGPQTGPVESIEEYGAREHVKDIELATPGHGAATYPDDDFASVPGGILRRLGSEVASERAAAVTDLARVGGDDAFREISASFDDPAQLVRDAAARALFDLQADHAASFTRALREAPSDRRRRIGNALASSGLANEAIGHLMGESREKTYDAFSLLFLMSKAGEVQPLMRAIEEHPNSEVRLAVVKLLALSGQQDILPAFRRLAVRGSLPTEVRSAVMEAIYQISSQASSDTSPVA